MATITGETGHGVTLSVTGPDGGDAPTASVVNAEVETLLDNDADLDDRLSTIETDDANDKYVIGNGTPPLAGYVPLVRAIQIAGSYGIVFNCPVGFDPSNEVQGTLKLNAAAGISYVPSRTYTRPVKGAMVTSDPYVAVDQVAVSANNTGYQPIDCVPDGASITSVKIAIDPVDDGMTPGAKTIVALKKKLFSTGVVSTVASFTDTSSSESYHIVELDLSGSPEVVDETLYEYFVHVTGETGGNANSITWHGSRIGFTLSDALAR